MFSRAGVLSEAHVVFATTDSLFPYGCKIHETLLLLDQVESVISRPAFEGSTCLGQFHPGKSPFGIT